MLINIWWIPTQFFEVQEDVFVLQGGGGTALKKYAIASDVPGLVSHVHTQQQIDVRDGLRKLHMDGGGGIFKARWRDVLYIYI